MKGKIYIFYLLLLCGFSCNEDIPLVSLGLDDQYVTYRMKSVDLKPEYTGESYRWTLTKEDGKDSLLSTEKDYIFLMQDIGTYNLTFEIIDSNNPLKHQMKFYVIEEQVAYSPYLAHVYEYKPAPGQFVNKIPEYEDGDTEEIMRQKAEEYLKGASTSLVTLGAYGGYITFGFDHTVMNVKGKRDFMLYGNAFYAVQGSSSQEGSGSSEPGIVMVSFDTNQNGIPDDEWYELAGSEYYKPETIKGYEITYYRPDENKIPTPDNDYPILNDTTYIKWTSNQGDYGYVSRNVYHNQSYFPQWIANDILTFKGTKLANNYIDASGNGSYYVQYPYSWGYVDNHPNEIQDENGEWLISFDIDWAVDKNGNKVDLRGVDFIRVYTGVNQYCGWLGETSTEISKAQDLHIYVKPNQNKSLKR